jgi:hypothetical protein
MIGKRTLPTVAGLALVGTATGIWLGGEAVGEINPFFFSERETSFVSDRMPYRSPDWAGVQIGEYQQQGLLDGIDRGPMPGPVYASPPVASYGQSWAAATEQETRSVRVAIASQAPVRVWTAREPALAEEPGWVEHERLQPEPEAAERERAWRRVERYASYRVADQPVEDEAPLVGEPEAEAWAMAGEAGTD